MTNKCEEKNESGNGCTGVIGPSFPDLPADPTDPSIPDDGGSAPPGCSSGEGASPLATTGTYCPTSSSNECSEFELEGGMENCLINEIIEESLQIGGATINVYKLLGVHEQGRLIDCTGHGAGISGGYANGYPPENAFTKFDNQWKSIQRGAGVTASAYIGYDFGEIGTNDFSRNAYGRETYVMKHITAIDIKQTGAKVTEARIERSFDGNKWYGVARISLIDDECLNTVLFSDSVPSRFWRIRPVKFSGGTADRWSVSALKMYHNYVATETHNIQDKVFLENRDRDYDIEGQQMKGYYDLYDSVTELGRFGIELPSQTIYLSLSFSKAVELLGRPPVIGDIIEIPAEAMYSSKLRRVEKWLEVIDVAWSTEGYTPGWNPTMLRCILQPAFASQETQDIFGDMASFEVEDGVGLIDQEHGKDQVFQDYFDAGQTMLAEAKDAVPQRGREMSSTIRAWEKSEIEKAKETVYDDNGNVLQKGIVNLQKIGLNPKGMFGEDAIPGNNAPFTESDEWPTNPTHGDYHRLTYNSISKEIPARLFRYSEVKGNWVYLETDRRHQFGKNVPMLQEFAGDPRSRAGSEIIRDKPNWRNRIRKSCDILPHTTTKNTKPPETNDNTEDFIVTSDYRANNTLKPMSSNTDETPDPGDSDPCPQKEDENEVG